MEGTPRGIDFVTLANQDLIKTQRQLDGATSFKENDLRDVGEEVRTELAEEEIASINAAQKQLDRITPITNLAPTEHERVVQELRDEGLIDRKAA